MRELEICCPDRECIVGNPDVVLGHVVGQVAGEPCATIQEPTPRPFTIYGHSTLQSGTDLMEYICNENNKDVQHILGKDPRNQLGLK